MIKGVILVLCLIFIQGNFATSPTPTSNNHVQLELRLALKDSIDFFEQEKNPESLQKIIQNILQNFSTDKELIQKAIEYTIKQKNRPALFALLKQINQINKCALEINSICTQLKNSWENYLKNLTFFEDSSSKIQHIRLLLNKKDCAPIPSILNALEAQEGRSNDLLALEESTYECLGNLEKSNAAKVENSLLKFFERTKK